MAARPPDPRVVAAAHAAASEAIARGDDARAVAPLRLLATAVPDNPQVLFNLGLALSRLDQVGEAAQWLSRAVALAPPYPAALRLLSRQLRLMPAFSPDTIAIAGLAPGLSAAGLDHQPFVRAVLDLVKQAPPLADLIAHGRREGWPAAARNLFAKTGRALLANRRFLESLRNGVNVDYEIELLLTAARHQLLLDGADLLQRPHVVAFASALATQCWNNEYVFAAAEDERQRINALADALTRQPFDAQAVDSADLFALLMYMPAPTLWPGLGVDAVAKVRPAALRAVIADQVAQARDEAALAAALPALARTSDRTSLAVARHYEENPYPRWLSTDLPEPGDTAARLRPFFDDGERRQLDQAPIVLIAGCGTGRQVVDLATQFGPAAQIVAVDLSAAALGYAARMAQQYGLTNVRFYRGDLLNLAALDETFALIVCDGVLHHMAEPIAGWRALVARLSPGGMMRISLYSRLARAHLARDREWAGAPGDAVTDPDRLRAFRAAILNRNLEDRTGPAYSAYDYFTLSTFRDLVFHAHEVQYTLPEITEMLDALGLEFRGFELPRPVIAAFRQRHGDAADRDLTAWHAFEQAEPATFANMYSFWCLKPA